MVENGTFRQNVKFLPILGECQQVGYKTLCGLKLGLRLQFLQYYIIVTPLDVLPQNVTQCELMRLFEGDIKTDISNSTYCSISKEHFDTKMIFIPYSYQKLKMI